MDNLERVLIGDRSGTTQLGDREEKESWLRWCLLFSASCGLHGGLFLLLLWQNWQFSASGGSQGTTEKWIAVELWSAPTASSPPTEPAIALPNPVQTPIPAIAPSTTTTTEILRAPVQPKKSSSSVTIPTPQPSRSPAPLSTSDSPQPTPPPVPNPPPANPDPVPAPRRSPLPSPSPNPTPNPSPRPAASPSPSPASRPNPPASSSGNGNHSSTAPAGNGATDNPVGFTAQMGQLTLTISDRDIPDTLAQPKQPQRQFSAVDYLRPLDLSFTQTVAIELVLIINEDGTAELYPEGTKIIEGEIDRDKANRLAKNLIASWTFTPTMTKGQATAQEYRLMLRLQPIF